ncbi:hypothetical protein QX249_10070 [Vibrio parahaemolyticus]|uniref:Uncharacterized protein n=1 Tax=Vibrio parahaemolyticus TaxID=670 RepID=A0AAW8PYB4_VIBPH|nr:hypothetical protein [Vibrio parahaemolyticus]EGR2229610.1 hypothetical protein [Vibrio parahaemolyticus]MDS1821004.1 hypothetical protein [Vibrio parahaemolyticus]
MSKNGYTLVEHSGINGAVELRSIASASEKKKVIAENGVILSSYEKASDAEYKVNYPEGAEGINPVPTKTFSKKRISGQRIYCPTPEFKEILGSLVAE